MFIKEGERLVFGFAWMNHCNVQWLFATIWNVAGVSKSRALNRPWCACISMDKEQWTLLWCCAHCQALTSPFTPSILERLCRARPRGRARGRTTLGVHPLSWLLSNNWLEKVPFVSVPHTSSNRLLLSNQDKGCTPSVAHALALPLGPALHNVWNMLSPMTLMHSNYLHHVWLVHLLTPCDRTLSVGTPTFSIVYS